MRNLNIAVAGLGSAASALHLPALRGLAGVQLVGGCDPDDTRRAVAAATWRCPVFADVAMLLDQASPDVLVVCTPPTTHRDVVLQALERGAHVFCEKPLATSVREADQLVAAAEAAGRVLAVNHEFREMPACRAVLDVLGEDRSGLIFAQAWQLMDLPPWREPGWRGQLRRGVLYEAGIHLVDFVLAAFGELPVRVSAVASTCGVREEETDSVALLTLEFSGGRLAQVTQHRLCKGETQYFELRADTAHDSYRISYGGRARLSAGLLRSTHPHVRVEMAASGMSWRERGHRRFRLAANPRNAPMVATSRLIARTISAIRLNATPPTPGAVGRDALAVVAAAYVSDRERRTVSLDGPDRDRIASYEFES